MAPKANKEVIKFESNKTVQVVLDTEPASAKSNTRDTEWGVKTSYTYFTKDGRVMFPSQALHDRLSNYSKGDTVSITLVDGKTWLVTSDSAGFEKKKEINKALETTETVVILRQLSRDIEMIKAHILGSGNDVKTNNDKQTETDLDF